MTIDTDTLFEVLPNFLEFIRKKCIETSLSLSFDDKNIQDTYMQSIFSVVVELADDCCQALRQEKELASHVLTRALLEAVVDLINVIKDPDYVNIRFQKALLERKKKLRYLLENEPQCIPETGHDLEYVESYIDRIDTLLKPKIAKMNIKERFIGADMEDYYDSAYSLLCDYTHHDASAIARRTFAFDTIRLDKEGMLMLSDLIAELLIKATNAVHGYLDSNQIEILEDLKRQWKDVYCQQSLSLRPG
jgi:hypothetical protein